MAAPTTKPKKTACIFYYQNGADRLTSPMLRRAGGSYEAIDWYTAIGEIVTKFAAIKSQPAAGAAYESFTSPTKAAA